MKTIILTRDGFTAFLEHISVSQMCAFLSVLFISKLSSYLYTWVVLIQKFLYSVEISAEMYIRAGYLLTSA